MEHLENVPLLANDSARGTHLSFSIKQLPIAKEHFNRWMEIFTSTTDELFAEPLLKLNYAPRIWQKCSIIN
jgi:truncated hemoglobin YjbI